MPSSAIQPLKPLGTKAYGSIPHLPCSRMGPGDHHCHEGQARICTERARDRHDLITVTVKLDGSCVSVARVDGKIVPLIRAGYPAVSSNYEQHRLFHVWAMSNLDRFDYSLGEGERLCGEWLAQAHGTRYELKHDPFVAFDLIDKTGRLPYAELTRRCESAGFSMPMLISSGIPISVERVTRLISTPYHGERDPVEGAVWRVERKGEFDFMCKWVRPGKADGVYLPEISGRDAIWHWRP